MHGVGSDRHEMDTVGRVIREIHPGTVTTTLPLFENSNSFLTPLQTQLPAIITAVKNVVAANASLYAGGYHLVCKSQGALLCRCLCEEMDDHNVSSFVSLAGPQLGVFGQAYFDNAHWPSWIRSWLPSFSKSLIWSVAYTSLAQDHISDANMWRDPNHLSDFNAHTTFIPRYNGDNAPAADVARFKRNFGRLRKAVFCVGNKSAYDGGIEPWQTGAWGSYDASGAMVNLTAQAFFVDDTFGLRTLHESGRLNVSISSWASHGDWTSNSDLIQQYVLPHLD